jgi:hypothetical protein
MATTKRKKENAKLLPMELPRAPRNLRAFEQGRMFRLRLPPDLSEDIEKEAVASGKPQNRIIMDRLAREMSNNATVTQASLNAHMADLLARYGARISSLEYGEDLIAAAEAVVNAEPGALAAKVDKLRIALRAVRSIKQK